MLVGPRVKVCLLQRIRDYRGAANPGSHLRAQWFAGDRAFRPTTAEAGTARAKHSTIAGVVWAQGGLRPGFGWPQAARGCGDGRAAFPVKFCFWLLGITQIRPVNCKLQRAPTCTSLNSVKFLRAVLDGEFAGIVGWCCINTTNTSTASSSGVRFLSCRYLASVIP